MSDSLRDQLLKSGLVKTLRRAEKPVREAPGHRGSKAARKSAGAATVGAVEPDLARAYALRARQEKRERERAKAEAQRATRERKERKRRLLELLDGKGLNSPQADVARHFPHRDKIRRIYCTREQLVQLNRGELAVVQLAGRFLLVTRELALQARQIQPESLVLLCDPDAAGEDDVPDDLIW